jgi:Na+-driven multidrug efflux pump
MMTPEPGRTHAFRVVGVVGAALASVAVEAITAMVSAAIIAVRDGRRVRISATVRTAGIECRPAT